jgi:hypothetical protein
MEKRKQLSVLSICLIILIYPAISTAHINLNFEKDYYWAEDYYHSSDFVRTSSQTYRLNTHNEGYKFSSFEAYQDYLFVKHHPYLFINTPKIEQRANIITNPNQIGTMHQQYQQLPYYRSPSYPIEGIKGEYIYYSPTTNKIVKKSCYIVPPLNSIAYVKC